MFHYQYVYTINKLFPFVQNSLAMMYPILIIAIQANACDPSVLFNQQRRGKVHNGHVCMYKLLVTQISSDGNMYAYMYFISLSLYKLILGFIGFALTRSICINSFSAKLL